MQSLSTFFGNVKRVFMEMGDGGLEVVGPPQISFRLYTFQIEYMH